MQLGIVVVKMWWGGMEKISYEAIFWRQKDALECKLSIIRKNIHNLFYVLLLSYLMSFYFIVHFFSNNCFVITNVSKVVMQ